MTPVINMILESSYNLWGHVEGGGSILHYKPPVADIFSAKGLINAEVSGEQKHEELQSWWTKDNREGDKDKKSPFTE